MKIEQQKRYRAWAEIDLSALEHNVNVVRGNLPSQTAFMAVVKANAYGHGDEAICKKLWELGVQWFAVSNLEEALAVRSFCPYSEIFILGYTPPEFAPELARNNIIQGVVSTEYAKQLQQFAHQPVRCHLKIDTGMGRIGFRYNTPGDCAAALKPLFGLEKLSIEGVYTHFAVADSMMPNDMMYTNNQQDFIIAIYDKLKESGCPVKHLHFMNSAATILRPNPRATLARVGIVMYGLQPNYMETDIRIPLKPVMSLRSVVSQVKTIQEGDSISYGRMYIAPSPRKIATVTIGYADGYARLLSNRAQAILHGKRCLVVGRVCMDQLMLDVTDVPTEIKPGDVVTMFGTDGNETITADELASIYDTIGYEVVCGISKRVPRDTINCNV